MSRQEQKAQTLQRITEAAARSFRKGGFGGIGVDGLAKAAGVTSGAFYVHYGSKNEAFCAAIVQGMADLKAGVLYCQETWGQAWWEGFVRFYLGAKRQCDLSESCSLQSLSPEVARSTPEAREAFEAGLQDVAAAILAGPKSPKAPRDLDAACAALAALVGAVTLARAVSSSTLADEIAAATGKALLGPRWSAGESQ
ncbi:TetR/AcrR family transcriptional regulator [Viridibacterium curvum]|uniref:TetR/AcrR family transcriptional regulator n=1 Tax=Viridibacterium curvum TaxID=1101404 RepID=A0ABP9QPH7_9RHOO